ncbi:hypothetical protein J7J84_05160 [bacterium]|nr:hypothetical protein [bacterium]
MENVCEPSFLRKKQIECLHSFVDAAERANLGLWVCGGWGVEALAMEQYPREHYDLDFLVFRLYSSAFHRMARRLHFSFAGESYYGFNLRKYSGGALIRVQIGFFDWEEDGSLVTYLPEHTVNWPCADPADLPRLPVSGKDVPCCDWEMMFAANQVYSFLNPEEEESPDAELISKQVSAARRKAIARQLIVPYGPEPV